MSTLPIAEAIPTTDPVATAVLAGLTAIPKSLPAWLFYDAEGSRLFERITELPEYYLTRTERAIFTAEADRIITTAQQNYTDATCKRGGKLRLLELGAGSASKTGILLAAAVQAQGDTDYLPVDVSATAMENACDSLFQVLPRVRIQPQVANYVTDALVIPAHDGPTLALYIGSSIGNFSHSEAVVILRNLRAQLNPGDTLLLGTDLVKDVTVLESAYCDAAGVTAAFNLNVLRRLNRDLGASFDLSAFRHVACFNHEQSRIEMHLKSTRNQVVRIPALDQSIPFQAGETIHTENSYKFNQESIADLLTEVGFTPNLTLTDDRTYFAVTLASVTPRRSSGIV